MAIFDFTCAAGHTTEAIRRPAVIGIACPVCARMARRSGVNRGIGIVGPTTDTRGLFRRYQEASAEIDFAAQRVEAQTGQPARVPDFWGAAKQRAAAIERAGENPLPQRKDT